MRVVIVEPGKYARIEEIENTLEAKQEIVGGLIDVAYPWREKVGIVCNDEGLLLGMPLNRTVPGYNVIAGTFIICGLGDENFISLTEEQAERYRKQFHQPQVFMRTPHGVTAISCTPKQYNEVMGITEEPAKPQQPKKPAHTTPER